MRMAARLERMGRLEYAGLTQSSAAGSVWTGEVREADMGDVPPPLRWRKPRRVFVNSMSDLFHPGVRDDHIARVFAIMACAWQHTFQVLTKRPERMATLLRTSAFHDALRTWVTEYTVLNEAHADVLARYRAVPLPNVWLGTSVEDQRRADERIPHLLATPAQVRFLSCEPLIAPVSLRQWMCLPQPDGGTAWCDQGGINWVIAGGESGPHARPMHPHWVRSLRQQCEAASVPFFFKQWGEWLPGDVMESGPNEVSVALLMHERLAVLNRDGTLVHDGGRFADGACLMTRVGKRNAGAQLDGVECREFPE